MFKKISNKVASDHIAMNYSICKIKNVLIVKHYNQAKWFLRDLKELLLGFIISVFHVVVFPIILIYTLLDFLPKIRIIDSNIDKKKQEAEYKANKEMEERFRK